MTSTAGLNPDRQEGDRAAGLNPDRQEGDRGVGVSDAWWASNGQITPGSLAARGLVQCGFSCKKLAEDDGMNSRLDRLCELTWIVAHALDLTWADMQDDVDLRTTYAADEFFEARILSGIEEKYQVTIPASALPQGLTIQSLYSVVVAHHAGWRE